MGIRINVERHQNAVDLILKLRPFGIADMDLLILIDRDPGHLSQNICYGRVFAPWQVEDVFGGYRVIVCSGGGDARSTGESLDDDRCQIVCRKRSGPSHEEDKECSVARYSRKFSHVNYDGSFGTESGLSPVLIIC